MHPPLPGDKRAGYLGLVVGFVAILVTVFLIVELTSRKFEGHAAAPHAGAPAAGAPAAHGTPPPTGTPTSGAPTQSAPPAAPKQH